MLCGLVCACSLGSPKEPLVPTPVDRVPEAPGVPDAPTPAVRTAVQVTTLDSGLTVIRATRPGSRTVGLTLVSRVPHPIEAGDFEARRFVQNLLVQRSPLERYGFVGESAPRGVALSAEVLGPDANAAMHALVATLGTNQWPGKEVAELRLARQTELQREGWSPRLAARQYALAHLFGADEALAVDHAARRSRLEGLSRDDLDALVHDLYTAKQTALCVVGDDSFTGAVLARASELPLTTKTAYSQGVFVQPTLAPNAVYLVDLGSYQAYVAIAGVAPTATEADFPAMWLLDRLVGGMFSSAMNVELRERRTLTYHANTFLVTSQAFGAWLFEAAIDGNEVSAALAAITQQFQLIRRGISTDEFLRARAAAVAELEARLETTGDLLAWLAWRFQQGLESTDVGSFVERVRALSREDVQRVAQSYLPEDPGPVVIAGTSNHIRAQLLWSKYRVMDATAPDPRRRPPQRPPVSQ